MKKDNYIIKEEKNSKIPILFCCDHSSNSIPDYYNNLGLSDSLLNQHIAYDIGANKLTKILAKTFKTNCILARYSRLLIDLNRDPNHLNLIPKYSDNTLIKKNRNLSTKEKKKRIKLYHETYHENLRKLLNKMDIENKCKTSLICIHSFTPSLKNQLYDRPWDIGLLYRKDTRIQKPLEKYLKSIKSLNIGDNLPYSGFDDVNYTMTHHGEEQNRPFISIEVKNNVFNINNKKRLKKIIESITIGIYKSHVSMGKPYNKVTINKNVLGK